MNPHADLRRPHGSCRPSSKDADHRRTSARVSVRDGEVAEPSAIHHEIGRTSVTVPGEPRATEHDNAVRGGGRRKPEGLLWRNDHAHVRLASAF